MRTIYGVLFIALLAATLVAGTPNPPEYCSANGALLPSATACSDEDPDECKSLFKTDPSDVGVTPVKRDETCTLFLKTFAIDKCAKRCALCCLTPQYDCQDTKGYDCAALKDSCKITTPQALRDKMIKLCPLTCGLCNAAGACRDYLPSCAAAAMLCHNEMMGPIWREQCPMTCGTCDQKKTPETTTALPTSPPTVAPPQPSAGQPSPPQPSPAQCKDQLKRCSSTYAHLCNTEKYRAFMTHNCPVTCGICGECRESRECAYFVSKGFCTKKTFYTPGFLRKTCGKSCGFC